MNEKISIIMGAYNCEDTITDAIESILKQSYSNWEFIICDDASTDSTLNILLKYKEKFPDKFIILSNEKNSKLAYSLNKCLKKASGKYIARMDADDLSEVTRFEVQEKFLRENSQIDLVGTAMQRFDENGLHEILYNEERPNKYSMQKSAPFNHATILTYKYVYDRLEGYKVSELTNRSQDHELWFRFFYEGFNGANIQQALYFIREDSKAIKRRTTQTRMNGLKITLNGYRLLNFPKMWYIKAILTTIIKIIIPTKIVIAYRKYLTSKN